MNNMNYLLMICAALFVVVTIYKNDKLSTGIQGLSAQLSFLESSLKSTPPPSPRALPKPHKAQIRKCRDLIQQSTCVLTPTRTPRPFWMGSFVFDKYVSSMVIERGVWDANIQGILQYVFANRKCYVMIDVGANIGFFSQLGASYGCEVFAFEPQKRQALAVEAASCMNGWDNRVHVHHGAVSHEKSLNFPAQFNGENPGSVSQDLCKESGGAGCVQVDTYRLDEVVSSEKDVTVMKVDVEGYESVAFATGRRLLETKQVKNIVLEWTPGVLGLEKNTKLLQELLDYGYHLAAVPFVHSKDVKDVAHPEKQCVVEPIDARKVREWAASITIHHIDVWATLDPANFGKYNLKQG